MDNMRHLLSSFDSTAAIHLGFRYENPNNGKHFMSGGPGYVLTRESIRRFVEMGIGNATNGLPTTLSPGKMNPCPASQEGLEDANLGICHSAFNTSTCSVLSKKLFENVSVPGNCLEKLNVTAGDSRDEYKVERFLPWSLEDMICGHLKYKQEDYWMLREWSFYYPLKQVGVNCPRKQITWATQIICFNCMVNVVVFVVRTWNAAHDMLWLSTT